MSDEGEIDVESDEISEVADGTDGRNRNSGKVRHFFSKVEFMKYASR